jgi:hypothetical protein
MTGNARMPATGFPLTLLVIATLLLMPVAAGAFDGSEDETPSCRRQLEGSEKGGKLKSPKFSHLLYSNLTIGASPSFSHFSYLLYNKTKLQPTSSGGLGSAPAVSTAPMTSGEKFKLFYKSSFLSPSAYGLSLLSGVLGEATDNDHGRHMSAGDFAADSLSRAARSMAFRTTANFFEKFAYSVALKQDPRYHRSNRHSTGARFKYALSRLLITQGDNNGKDEFNISQLLGGLTAASIANAWERPERRDIEHTFSRFGKHLAITALKNLLREFLGRQ